MKLYNNLYYISSKDSTELSVSYVIQLNVSHFIYQAHFPGQPITPGVCVIQIVKELLEDYSHHHLEIQRVKSVKFLNVISPIDNPNLVYKFTNLVIDHTAETYKAQVQILSEGLLMAKLSFLCK